MEEGAWVSGLARKMLKSRSSLNHYQIEAERMDWRNTVIPKVIYKLEHEYTFKPTIRGMFYNLASDGVIENTQKHYKGLDKALSDARKRLSGDEGYIEPNAFVDNSREIIDITNDEYWTPQDVFDHYKNKLKNLSKEYFSLDNIPRWHKQEHYVEGTLCRSLG